MGTHAPIRIRRVKSQRLPEWCTPEILSARRMRDSFKKAKNWSQYKIYRSYTQSKAASFFSINCFSKRH